MAMGKLHFEHLKWIPQVEMTRQSIEVAEVGSKLTYSTPFSHISASSPHVDSPLVISPVMGNGPGAEPCVKLKVEEV